jgi:hypothetical protein
MVSKQSSHDVFLYIWSYNPEMQVRIITTIYMCLRTERNSVNASEKQKQATQVGFQIQRYATEFLEFFSKPPIQQQYHNVKGGRSLEMF